MKLGKHFTLIYSPCFIKPGVVQFCIVVLYFKFIHMHADFRGGISGKKCILYTAGKWIYMQYFIHDIHL